MSTIRLALLGCGDVAQRVYLPEFSRTAHRAELVAVCGKGERRAPDLSVDHALHVIEIIQAGYRAADTGQDQELTTSF